MNFLNNSIFYEHHNAGSILYKGSRYENKEETHYHPGSITNDINGFSFVPGEYRTRNILVEKERMDPLLIYKSAFKYYKENFLVGFNELPKTISYADETTKAINGNGKYYSYGLDPNNEYNHRDSKLNSKEYDIKYTVYMCPNTI